MKISKKIKKRKNNKFLFFYSYYYFLQSYLSEIKHFFINYKGKKKKPLLARRSIKEKIPGGLNKKEINKFYDNITKGKKITVKQLGPNGFLISQ